MKVTFTKTGESKNFWVFQDPDEGIVGKLYISKKKYPLPPTKVEVEVVA